MIVQAGAKLERLASNALIWLRSDLSSLSSRRVGCLEMLRAICTTRCETYQLWCSQPIRVASFLRVIFIAYSTAQKLEWIPLDSLTNHLI